MPRLVLVHSRRINISILDPEKALQQSSPEQVTNAIEKAVRSEYPSDDVQILSKPVLNRGRFWIGKCRIGQMEYSYQLMEGLEE
jgi:hypothetical protein